MVIEALREQIKGFLGINSGNIVPDYRVIEEQECDGYKRSLICYQGSENDKIPAYLLIPNGEGVFPAVLIHHQR